LYRTPSADRSDSPGTGYRAVGAVDSNALHDAHESASALSAFSTPNLRFIAGPRQAVASWIAMSPDDSGGRAVGGIYASAAVQALIGDETLGRLRGQAFRRYSCCRCGQPGSIGAEQASVIVERYRLRAVRVRLAHARCAVSQVVEVAADAPSAAGFGGMLSKSAVLEYATEPRVRPLLILEPKIELSEATAGGEQMNLLLSGLLDRGFTMLRTAGQLPALADGWLLQFTPGAGRLLAPDDAVAFEGPLSQPASWIQLVRRSQACVVLVGTIGLYARADEDMTTADLRRLLNGAARAGELAGSLVRAEKAR
jgi:hypothetical protein